MYIHNLISVIIPVYNVEKYLEKCLKSVQNQSYAHFEVILINDGSTDSSLKICEAFIKKDKRFSVLTKENGGLSSARNLGLKKIRGKYVTFVDSDDYLSEHYLKHFVSGIESEKSIVCSKFLLVDENGVFLSKRQRIQEKKLIFSKEEGIKEILLQNKMDHSAWGKLYPISFFENITFPDGKLFEDMGTTYKLLALANEVVFLDEYDYYYLQQPNSIMNSSFNLKKLDIIDMSKEMIKDIVNTCPQLVNYAKNRAFSAEAGIFLDVPNTKAFESSQKLLWKEVRENRYAPFLIKGARLKNKLGAILSFLGRRFFLKLGKQLVGK